MYCTELRSEFEARLQTITYMIAGYTRSQERRQNALCWAWHYWPAAVASAATLDEAARDATYNAVRRRQTFGREPQRLKRAKPVFGALDTDVAMERGDDCERISWRIQDMPAKLRSVAQLLAEGHTGRQIASELGISEDTVTRRRQAIADWILAQGVQA